MNLQVQATLPSADSRVVTGAGRTGHVEWPVCGAILFTVAGHLLIKFGLNSVSTTAITHQSLVHRLLAYVFQPVVLLGLGVYAIGTLLWLLAVSKREISYLFPLSAMNYVLVTVGGMALFGESIPAGRWLGILVVVTGVVLMQCGGRGEL